MNLGDIQIADFRLGDIQPVKLCLGATEVWSPGGVGPGVSLCDAISEYLTFEIVTGGDIGWHNDQGNDVLEIEFSVNGGSWNPLGGQGAGDTVSISGLQPGDKVRFRGNNPTYDDNGKNRFEGSTATYQIYGNIMSLIYGDGFVGQYEFPSGTQSNFMTMWEQEGQHIVDTQYLVLPATAATSMCYTGLLANGMVNGVICLMVQTAQDWNLGMIPNGVSGTMYCYPGETSNMENEFSYLQPDNWSFVDYPCNLPQNNN